MIVGSYFKYEDIESARSALLALPATLRPTHFGLRESGPSATSKIAAAEKYSNFLAANAAGYFLFSDRCRFNFTPNFRSGYGTVFVDSRRERFVDDEARILFDALRCDGAASFTFACQPGEYDRRNKVNRQIGVNHIEAWVGRDLGRYVPGIYWLTSIGGDSAARLDLRGLDSLSPNARIHRAPAGSVQIEFPNDSEAWGSWEQSVSEVSFPQPGIFCLERALATPEPAMTYLELSTALAKWP